MMRILLKVVAWCCFSGLATLTNAHHSISAYAVDETLEITGVVSRVGFVNPHAYYMVDVTDEAGIVTSWKVETAPPAVLRGRGWGPGTVQVGDQVVANGAPLASGDPEMNLEFIVLADGTQLGRTGAPSEGLPQENGPPAAAGGGGPRFAAGGMGMGRGMGGTIPDEPEPSGAPRDLLTGVWSTNWGSTYSRPGDPQAQEKLTDAGRANLEAFDINTENMANCRLVGAPRLARGTVYSNEIVDNGDNLYIIAEYNAQTRRIHMDGQQPHEYFAPNRLGWSNGEFADGVLTITTRHLTGEYINASGGYYFGGGEDAYMVEKIHVREDGDELVYFAWFHDPVNYTQPYRTVQSWARMNVDEGFSLDCDPTEYTLAGER